MPESEWFFDRRVSTPIIRKPCPSALFSFVPSSELEHRLPVGSGTKTLALPTPSPSSGGKPILAICPANPTPASVSIHSKSLSEVLNRSRYASATGLYPTEPKSEMELKRCSSIDSGRSSMKTIASVSSGKAIKAKGVKISVKKDKKTVSKAVVEDKPEEKKAEDKAVKDGKEFTTIESFVIRKRSEQQDPPSVIPRRNQESVTLSVAKAILENPKDSKPVSVRESTLPRWRHRDVSETVSRSRITSPVQELTKVEPPSILSNNRALHMELTTTVTEWER